MTTFVSCAIHSARKQIKRFKSEIKGNIAMIFAVSLLPIFLMIGFTVDHNRQHSEQRKVQAAADATVLAVARATMEADLSEAELLPIAQKVFDAQYVGHGTVNLNPVDVKIVGDEIIVTVDGQMDTTLMKMAGNNEVPIGAEAAAVYNLDIPIEIALVLDTSGSMSGQKLNDLKSSARSLVDVVLPSMTPSENGKVTMSVVPFARYVNVGTANRYEPWMDAPDNKSGTKESCSVTSSAKKAAGCKQQSYSCKKWKGSKEKGNLTSYTGTCKKWVCPAGAEPEKTCKDKKWSKKWYGCVASRPYPLNIQDKDYTSTQVKGFYGNACPSALQPLTNSHQKVDQAINKLSAKNDTYIPTGLVWGYRTLSPSDPFDEGQSYKTMKDENGRKVLILMSDGANTRSPKSNGKHDGSDQTLADTYTLEVCDEAKAQEIEIYTIAFDLKDTATKTMLESCATTSDYFFDAADAAELDKAFKDIGEDLSESLALSS
ncbi:MAG: pilus assembly protein TadG-related protein [Pseudomonadota bacterium]